MTNLDAILLTVFVFAALAFVGTEIFLEDKENDDR